MKLFGTTIMRFETIGSRDTFGMVLRCPPDIAAACRPGQFVMLGLPDPSRRDPLLKRPFSICRRDHESITLIIRQVGRGTALLAGCRTGTTLEVNGPLGRGFPDEVLAGDRDLMIVGGGIGMAALIMLLDEYVARALLLERLRIVYGARNDGDLVFSEWLRNFGTCGAHIELVTEDGSRGHRGLVTDILGPLLAATDSPPYLCACGPLPMLAAVGRQAAAASCPTFLSLESRMACGFGVCLGCIVRGRGEEDIGGGEHWLKTCTDGPVFQLDELDLDCLMSI
ncbi:MAG: dihydroorotate dehydrogenase electron transfer subunit [Deltaproteobacteria bacterium]|nr:dihydroorotate dehydrogenase electron transfer subunit [Candidatus Anaeroferrophillacea bacterium]